MASKKISELTEFADLEVFPDGAYVPLVSEGVTYKLKLENLLSKTLRTDKPSEISSVTAKSVISNNDLLMLEDSSSSNAKKSCTKAQFLSDVPQVLSGTEDPAAAPSKKGLIYINTGTGSIFIAAGTSSTDDWKAIYIAP
jgi:hypothetical protein